VPVVKAGDGFIIPLMEITASEIAISLVVILVIVTTLEPEDPDYTTGNGPG
jgi:hypothetical protein